MRQKPRCCHYCGAPLPDLRLGVRLSAFKARLFDLVLRSGLDGIMGRDLYTILYDKDPEADPKGFLVIKSHIKQINDSIEDTGYCIRSFGYTTSMKGAGFYRLEKKRERTN